MRNENARNSVLIRILMTALALVIAQAIGGTAYAVSSYRTAFRTAYPAAVGTRIDSCVLCHPTGTGPRNSFGSDFASSSIGNHTFNAALENRDSDGDGSTNLAEINALTFPGDAADKPAAVDTIPPAVSSTAPANNATGVAVGAAVTATFSEAVAPASVTASSFTVSGVTGTISVNGATVTFTPSAPLANSTSYTATLTTAVTDVAGNHLAANRTWTFTTAAAADTIPPAVSSTAPANNATGVAISAAVTATFSEAVAPASVTASSFTVSGVTGTISVNGATVTFTPSAPLANSTSYTATLTTAVTDVAGNHLAANRTWTFATTAAADSTGPRVSSVNPSDTQPGVPVNVDLTATFSEAVNVPAGAFTLSDGSGSVPGTVSVSGATATFIPSVILSDNTTYTVRVTNAVTDLTGNHLATDYSWTFTTSASLIEPTPSVESESAGGGCAMAGTRGDIKDLAGTYGILVLTALGIAVRGRMRKER